MTAMICLLIFLPALKCGFVNVDDPAYVLDNPLIRQISFESLSRMFFSPYAGWWMPLTWLSLAIDYYFWGLNPVGYHLTNILLHSVNTGIVVLIADRFVKLRAGARREGYLYPVILLIAGLFFGIHPLRVESVVWVTERKDVLNGLFVFLSILFYLQYAGRRRGGTSSGTRLLYLLSFLCFVFSLMSKSVSVVLPALLVLFDWASGRLQESSLGRLIFEKWPYWLATIVVILSTFFFAAQSRHLVSYEAFPLPQRVAVSGNALWEYVRMLALPIGLSPFDVIPDPVPVSYVVKAVFSALVLVWGAIYGWKKFPLLTVCLLGFLLPLLPVLAIFQNGDQSFADRFTYLPSLLPAVFLALFLCMRVRSTQEVSSHYPAIALLFAIMVVLMISTVKQQKIWRTSESFWTRVIQIEPLAISYKERGKLYLASRRYDEAVSDFSAALDRVTPTLRPYEYNFYAFRGEAFRQGGKHSEALSDFTTAISLHQHPVYYYHRGLVLKSMGRAVDAEEDFRRAGPESGPISWFE
ncbi:MAG: tetratricopeptide repeat protein [Geobacteraceae bacterium]|nr:tetratricopeptide repeat protein [Geobacteraceae bacterium]